MVTINNRKMCANCFAVIESGPCQFCGFNPRKHKNDPVALRLGSVLNKRYTIGGVIGKGGFGITYLAYDLKLDTKLAVKEYYPMGLALRLPGSTTVSVSDHDAEGSFRSGAEKFYSEAKMVARFNGNINIVSVHDFFYENDTVYFTMGYLKGETLKNHLKHSRLTEGQAVRVMQDISNALMAVHSSNILHRDISPDNIMLCDDGSIKLLDFGAARQVMAEKSQSLSVILKQGFAPLEQYQKKGKQGPWTDIYALGATVYNALTGELPDDPMSRFEDDSELMDSSHGISEELWNVIKKCMMLKIDDRYQDVFELRKDLNALGIEAEAIVEVNPEEQEIPMGETAKAFDSMAEEEDPNATELLAYKEQPGKEGETVLLRQELPVQQTGGHGQQNESPAPQSPGYDLRQDGSDRARNASAAGSANNSAPDYTPQQPAGCTPQGRPASGPGGGKSILPMALIIITLAAAAIIFAIVMVNKSSRKVVDDEILDSMNIKSMKSSPEDEPSPEETSEEKTEEPKDEESSEIAAGDKENSEDYENSPFKNDWTEPEKEDSGGISSEDNDNAEFGLDGSECSSYEAMTDFDVYKRYISDVDRFSFIYPVNLYSSVIREGGTFDGKSFEVVSFKRSDGSTLTYTASIYTDNSVEAELNYIYSNVKEAYYVAYEIYPTKMENGEGIMILTGKDKENHDMLVYTLARVSRDYVYEMVVTFPDFENDDDENWKSYYKECLYRACGFSNSSKSVRSYSDYLNAP